MTVATDPELLILHTLRLKSFVDADVVANAARLAESTASEILQRLATQGGLLFPPGILIDGEPFSYGRLSERKLRRELDRLLGFVDKPPYVLTALYRFPTGERIFLP